MGDEDDSSVKRFVNLDVPYATDVPGDGLFPGQAILLKLNVLQKSTDRRFSVDLCCGRLVHGDHRDDKALHLNARFDVSGSWFSKPDRDIVMNSLINNSWGPEQRAKNCIELGKPASIRILILRDYFKIAVNGKHLCDYIHRIPIKNIKCLYVTGCVELNVVEFQGGGPDDSPEASAPCANFNDFDEPISLIKPQVPLVCDIQGGFGGSRELHVVFTPRMDASQIAFNFNAGLEFLLHIRIDFPSATSDKKGAIVRNNTQGGAWQKEKRRIAGRFPFLPGITADIRVISENTHAKIIVDGNLLDIFEFRTGSKSVRPNQVDKVTITGDLSIQKFELKTSKN